MRGAHFDYGDGHELQLYRDGSIIVRFRSGAVGDILDDRRYDLTLGQLEALADALLDVANQIRIATLNDARRLNGLLRGGGKKGVSTSDGDDE